MTQSHATMSLQQQQQQQQHLVELEKVTKALSSGENAVRVQAEKQLQQLKQQPSALMPLLLNLIQQSSDVDVQMMCALVLRQCVQAADAATSAVIRAPLLEILVQGCSLPVHSKISDVVAAMATNKAVLKSWPELLPCVWSMLSSTSSRQHEAALSILDRIAEFDLNLLRPHLSNIWSLLAQVLSGTSVSSGTRLAALKTCISILVALDAEDAEALASSSIPKLMLHSIAHAQAEQDITGSLTALLELVGCRPNLFIGIIPDFASAMTSVANSSNLEPATRRLALEMLLSFLEGGPEVRHHKCLLESALPIALNLLMDVDDEWNIIVEPSGNQFEQHEDEEEDSSFSVGSNAFSRIAASNGAKVVLDLCGSTLSQWCTDAGSWKHRQAALMAIAYICDGCSARQAKQMQPLFEQWSQIVQRSCSDSVPRVRYAALELLSMMCGGFEGEFQVGAGRNLLQTLCTVLNDAHPRVLDQAHLCLATFCAGLEDNAEEHSLDGCENVLRILAGHLSQSATTSILRLEACLVGVSSLAQAMGTRFEPFYDSFMPQVIAFLSVQQATPRFIGKALECAGLIGAAVGKERFEKDGCSLVQHMLAMNATPDQEHYSYIQQTLARVSQTIRESFAVFLPSVLPPLLKSVALQDGVSVEHVSGTDEAEEEEGVDVVDVQLRGIGTRRIRMNTSMMEEKSLAANMLYQYAHDLGATFAPFAKTTAEALLPLAECQYNEQVRLAAVAALPALVSSLRAVDAAAAQQLAMLSIKAIVKAIGSEPDLYSMMLEVEAAADTIKGAGHRLGDELEKLLASALCVIVQESMERREERNQALKSPHADEHEFARVEEENSAETELIGHVVDCIEQLAHSGKDAFVPTFHKHLSSLFAQFIESGRTDDEIVAGLCVFDELLEHGGRQAHDLYLDAMLPVFMQHMLGESASVRQSAVYGVGVCAEVGGDRFARVARDCASKLVAMVRRPGSRSVEAGSATDNAISALAKVMQFHASVVSTSELWPLFLRMLPCIHDVVEAKVVHARFVHFVVASPATFCDSNSAFFADVVGVVATLLLSEDDLCEEETKTKLAQVWRELIRAKVPHEALLQLLTQHGLRQDQVNALVGL